MYKTHTYYYTCPYCEANLDPGETCDCLKDTSLDNDTTLFEGDTKEDEDHEPKQ